MLVKLYNVTPDHALIARLEQQQITLKRVLAPDAGRVIRTHEAAGAQAGGAGEGTMKPPIVIAMGG